eukprot:scaffold26577_cov53-Phaeocystis_antarctica.AAC.4
MSVARGRVQAQNKAVRGASAMTVMVVNRGQGYASGSNMMPLNSPMSAPWSAPPTQRAQPDMPPAVPQRPWVVPRLVFAISNE